MGGIAIFMAIAIPLTTLVDFSSLIGQIVKPNDPGRGESLSGVMLIGALLLFLLGFIDDRRNIKPQTKLVGQIVVASMVVFLGFRLHWFHSLTLDTMATLFWIVGLTNAFNLIDNMDGLCAGVGLVACLSLAVLFLPISPESHGIALILAGAMAGFLIYNFNPAKIFMGDCGSLVIGFCVSLLTLYFPNGKSDAPLLVRISVPVLILLVPILDTTLVTLIRILSGRKASTGGRDHTSHRLVLIGFSEKSAVLFLYAVGAIAGLAAVYVSISDTLTSPAVIIPVITAMILMGVYLSQLRVYPEKEFSVLRDRKFTPILLEMTYKRQILLVILDFVLIAFAYYLSYRLRFGGEQFSFYFKIFLNSLPAVIALKLIVFFIMGIYRGFWSYISTNDVFVYVRASLVGTLVIVAAVTYIYRFKDFSKGIFIIDFMLTTGLLLGVRGSFRMFLETQNRKTLSGEKVIIYGAGRAGELLLREILNNKKLNVNPIGFVDDDVLKKGKKIQGYSILGTFDDIDKIFLTQPIKGIIVSFNDICGTNSTSYEAVKKFCIDKGIFFKKFRIDLQDVDLDSKMQPASNHSN